MNISRLQLKRSNYLLAAGIVCTMVVAFSQQCHAENVKFTCNDSNYPSFESCTVMPNAVTIRENGVETKGHMVAGFECIKGVCTNYMQVPPKSYAYSCAMSDLPCFCTTVKPACKSGWSKR